MAKELNEKGVVSRWNEQEKVIYVAVVTPYTYTERDTMHAYNHKSLAFDRDDIGYAFEVPEN